MKKLNQIMIVSIASSLGLLSASVFAAQVSVTTPAPPGSDEYLLGSDIQLVYENEINGDVPGTVAHNDRFADFGIVNPQDNADGEELIWLGAHHTIDFFSPSSPNNLITVDVNRTDMTSDKTGGVSLVLSAAEALQWDITVDLSVITLNNIFVFALNNQAITINGMALSVDGDGEFFGSTRIERASTPACGYALPDDDQGCNTDSILGINRTTFDEFGFPIDSNPNGEKLLVDLGLTDLNVTSFNGSYLVDAFNVGINSNATVVPLPSGLVLFGSALIMFMTRSRVRA